MKKLLALLLVFLMLVATFTGCSDKGNTSSEPNDDVTADVSSDLDEDVSSEPDEDVSSEPEEDASSEPQYEYQEPEDNSSEPEDGDDEEDKDFENLSPVEQRYENMINGLDEKFNKEALVYEGELGRLAKAIKKAKAGETVKFVFYGNAPNTAMNTEYNTVDSPYADLFAEWFTVNYGPCEVYKAGSYSLTSKLACLRVEHDVLRFEPDVVFLDFAVQDAINSAATSNAYAYDNLIRRLLQSKSAPAVVTLLLTGAEQTSYKLNSNNPDTINTAAKQHKELAQYYKLPIIDFGYALWEAMSELVIVTTQMERPLMTWKSIASDNVTYKEDAHGMLLGNVCYLIDTVNSKLNKISTANYKYPTEGYYSNDEYMNTSFVNIADIDNGKAPGYSFDLKIQEDGDDLGYEFKPVDRNNSLTPCIVTYKHYISEADDTDAEKAFEENPHYLTLTLPKVEKDTYFMFCTTSLVGYKASVEGTHPLSAYSPISIICYDEKGVLTHSGKCVKLPSSDYASFSETPNMGKTSALLIPKGTTKVVFRIYDAYGTIYMLGVANK